MSKLWYLRQKVTVDRNRFTLWTKEEKSKVIINNLPYSFGDEHNMSVTNIYMKGLKNLMWVLEFRESLGKWGNVLVHPVLIFINTKDNTFYFKQIHSEQEFLNIAGKKNYRRWRKFTHLHSPIYKLD